MKSLEHRLDVIGAKIALRSPFISAVFVTLPKIIVEQGTAATDGKRIVFGRSFCDSLPEEELLGVAMHEACHVILGHIWRSEGFDPQLANIAQDAVINAMLRDMQFKLPSCAVFINWVTPAMDWEEVYRRLKQLNPTGLSDLINKFGSGGFDKKGDCSPCPDEATKADIEATILTAAKMAKACGEGSPLIDRVLKEIGKPTVRWQDVLRMVLRSADRSDYSFRRPARRLLSSNMYLPSLYSETIGGLAIGFDVSGSINDNEAATILAEINAIAEDCAPEWIEVACFDDKVTSVKRFERGEDLQIKLVGGGGTAFRPVFAHFAEVAQTDKIAAMIIFTDMEANDVNKLQEPEYPVIWGNVALGNARVPFGYHVKVNV